MLVPAKRANWPLKRGQNVSGTACETLKSPNGVKMRAKGADRAGCDRRQPLGANGCWLLWPSEEGTREALSKTKKGWCGGERNGGGGRVKRKGGGRGRKRKGGAGGERERGRRGE